MDIMNQESEAVLVRLSFDEISALNNALNESLEHLEEWEFQTRMGVTQAQVRTLLECFGQIKFQ
jgi:hypothetical protein